MVTGGPQVSIYTYYWALMHLLMIACTYNIGSFVHMLSQACNLPIASSPHVHDMGYF